MRVQVTEQDIATGMRGNAFCCPVAKAIRRTLQLRPEETVSVGNIRGYVDLHTCDQEQWFWLPPETIAFIEKYDREAPVSPFSFDLKEVKR